MMMVVVLLVDAVDVVPVDGMLGGRGVEAAEGDGAGDTALTGMDEGVDIAVGVANAEGVD